MPQSLTTSGVKHPRVDYLGSKFSGCPLEERKDKDVTDLLVLGPGWQAAGAILGLFSADENSDLAFQAGNCLDLEKEHAYAQLQVWLQARRRNRTSRVKS